MAIAGNERQVCGKFGAGMWQAPPQGHAARIMSRRNARAGDRRGTPAPGHGNKAPFEFKYLHLSAPNARPTDRPRAPPWPRPARGPPAPSGGWPADAPGMIGSAATVPDRCHPDATNRDHGVATDADRGTTFDCITPRKTTYCRSTIAKGPSRLLPATNQSTGSDLYFSNVTGQHLVRLSPESELWPKSGVILAACRPILTKSWLAAPISPKFGI